MEADTADLTLEEFGAYQKLLNFHFLQGSIPSDPARAARILGVSTQKFKKLWQVLSRYFCERNGAYQPVMPFTKPKDARMPWVKWRILRMDVFLRDGCVCAYCGDSDGPHEIDHVIPISRGGSNDKENLVVACRKCNRTKGAETWEPTHQKAMNDG